MTRSAVETILGGLVIVIAIWFLAFSYHAGHSGSTGEGFEVYADFSGIGGLKAGDAVEISGVKVGSVQAVDLVPDNYLARVHMNLKQGLKLPTDTAAAISSESVLGGQYLSLSPGGDDKMIQPGGRVQYTQAPQNLEELLGKFIFSVQDSKKDSKSASAPDAGGDLSAPVPAPTAKTETPKTAAPVTSAPAEAPKDQDKSPTSATEEPFTIPPPPSGVTPQPAQQAPATPAPAHP